MNRPVVLVILDGWGIAPDGPGNAITRANTPTMNQLIAGFPQTQLTAAGEAVGLPHGEDGNTETGHLNIGAGQIVYQDLPRINMSIVDGSYFENPAFMGAIDHVRQHNSKLHLLGLIGSGGVHSNIEHLFALMRMMKQNNLTGVYLHLITDGRDSPPTSGLNYIAQVKQVIASGIGVGTIASVMGRYWAMDRDRRWDRTEKAYGALTKGNGAAATSAEEAIQSSYTKGITDEFIEPTVIHGTDHQPIATMVDGDALIFFNFRIDRPRQLTRAFIMKDFSKANSGWGFDPYSVKYRKSHLERDINTVTAPFDRGEKLSNFYFVMMTEYSKEAIEDGAHVAFPPGRIDMPLGRIISQRGLRQLRIAETEKERFVTFYFNGQREEPFPLEDHLIIPSPRVATYDQKPEMSTPELSEVLSQKVRSGMYDFILVNIACPDMVAHTGNLEATKKACEAADAFIRVAISETLGIGGAVVVTSDHGNAEELVDQTSQKPDTEHSTAPVPIIIAAPQYRGRPQQLQTGILADVAPTILKLMGIEKPTAMTGRSLI